MLKPYIIRRSYGLGSAYYTVKAGDVTFELEFIYGDLIRAPMLSFRITTEDKGVAEVAKKYFGNWIKITKLDNRYLLQYIRNLWSGMSLSLNDYEEDRRQIKLIKNMIEEIIGE